MFRIKILLGLLISSLALLFPVGVFAQTNFIFVEPSTRTIENPYLKVRWDMNNSERVSELIYKPFSTSYNLAESPDLNEFFGNAQAFHPTIFANEAGLVNSFNMPGSTWAYTNNGQTARVEIHSISEHGSSITTVYEVDSNNPVFKVTRTFSFGTQPLINPSRVVPYFVRGYNRDNFTTYAWEKTDGTVGEIVGNCEAGCTPTDWAQSWFDLEAPGFNVGLGLISLQDIPQSTPWLDRDMNSYSAFISASIPNNGYTEDLTVSYLIVPHTGGYSAVDWESLRSLHRVPTPFLDLPWDYGPEVGSFSEAATNINAYFDHQYPLLSTAVGIDPVGLVSYRGGGVQTDLDYSGHDGYDWGTDAGAALGEPVLAAADGCAYYKYTGGPSGNGAGGNEIHIIHEGIGAGYETRYFHLRSDKDLNEDGVADAFLLTRQTNPDNCVDVIRGEQIGEVGFSGHVIPSGSGGAHLHFMVIYDKNGDGEFDDNIPDGIVDPFGWQSPGDDPWENYDFDQNNEEKTGARSYYLWTSQIANLSPELTANGGFYSLERYTLDFPPDTVSQVINIDMQISPRARVSDNLESIGSSLTVTAIDSLGILIHNFLNFFGISIGFSGFDLTPYRIDTLGIYSSENGINWTRENTAIDWDNQIASTSVNHLSHFALMAERIDPLSPNTSVTLVGEEVGQGFFSSDVEMALNAVDNEGGLGVDYTAYRVNDEDWQQYFTSRTFTEEGNYQIEFYSVDKDQNVEEIKTVVFSISKNAPEAKMYYDTQQRNLVVEGIDESETMTTEEDEGNQFTISDTAGKTLIISGQAERGSQEDSFEAFSLNYSDGLAVGPLNRKLLILDYLEEPLETDRYLVQRWYEDYYSRIEIVYKPLRNKSTIHIKLPGQPVQKEVRDGLVLLHIVTNRGNLEVTY